MRHNTSFRVGAGLVLAMSGIALAQPEPPATTKEEGDPALRSYYAGNGLLNRGMFEAAIAEYQAFLSAAPEHEKAPVARYGLVVSLYRLDRCDEAIKESRVLQGAKDFPYDAEVGLVVGQCHMAAGRFAEAAESFATVVASHQESELADDAACGRCEALYREGKYEDAVKECHAVATGWPQSPLMARTEFFRALAQMSGMDFAGAAQTLAAYEKSHPKSEFASQVPLLLGQCFQREQNAEKAIERYAAVVKAGDPKQVPDALLGLGALLQQTGRHAEAGKALDMLIAKFPDSSAAKSALLPRAQVWFAQGEFEKAFESFEKAAKADASLVPDADYWMAKCDLRRGNADAAATRFTKAMEEHPNYPLLPELTYDLAVARVQNKDPKAALAALRKFLAQFPGHALRADAILLAASCEQSVGNHASVVELCDQLGKEFPEHAQRPLAEFMGAENEALLDGRLEKAAARYRGYLERYPGDDRADLAKLNLGKALFQIEQFDEAAKNFEQVADKASSDGQFRPALLALGDMAFQRGEWKIAETRLSEYLAGGPESAGADDALMKLAYARQRQGRTKEAAQDYEQLISKFPKSGHRVQAMFERGQILAAARQTPEAEAVLKQALAEGGDGRFTAAILNQLGYLASQRGQQEEAARYYGQAAGKADGEQGSEALLRQGQSLMAAGKLGEAEAAFRKVKSPEGQARLAVALARQNRAEDALLVIATLQASGELTAIAPALREGLRYEKAWALRALKKNAEAVAAYREIITEKDAGPLRMSAMLELSELQANEKQFETAAATLRQLMDELSSQPDTAVELREQCAYRLGVCEFELGRFTPAAELFEQVIADHPQSKLLVSAQFYAGEANFRAGRIDRATKQLTAVLDAGADNEFVAPALLRLGECHAVLQKWALSEEAFQHYLDRFAGAEHWYQAQFRVGWSRENQKRYDEAIVAYEKVTVRHQGPTAARAQFQIGQCLFAQKKFEPAIRELLKVDILYAYPEWSAAALYEAGRCFTQLNDPVQARQQFNTVIEKYKDTRWAELAVRQMEELTSSAASLPGK